MTRRVVLLHGLWMPRASMRWHAARLREAGFQPKIFSYATVSGGPEAAVPSLVRLLNDGDTHILAHSLGGLVAVRALELHPQLPVRRVVCLGSPLCGSAAAASLMRWPLTASTLGRSAELLRHGCRPWSGPAEVGVIAGRMPVGLGQLFGRFRGDNDGTVAVAETRLPGLADHAVIATSHSGFLFSAEAARLAAHFFDHGRFQGEVL
jgi:pimeloyl-ACP methyl ester carboxylesterase